VSVSVRAGRASAAAALLALLMLGVTSALPAGTPGAPVDALATGGLTTTADARYVVDPATHRVHVAVTLSATNHLADTKTRRYFFDRSYLAVPASTAGYQVTSAGATPRVTVAARHTSYTLLRIDFGKQLAAGATRSFAIGFDIVDKGGAATRPLRIGASLVTFSAWGLGSDGATGGSVTVVFPKGYAIQPSGAGLGKPTTDAAGNTVFTTGRLANPLKFVASFAADRPNAFKETSFAVSIGGDSIPVTLRAWPDDPAWSKRVKALLAKGLPELAKEIGLPWTGGRPLIVQEAISRNTSGFAGRFDPTSHTIEIAYYADAFVILHEAAHAWFDGSFLADRWASEGFSSWYAIQAAKAIGEKKVTGDPLTPALAKLREPLNAWGPATPDTAPTKAEDAEYAAALTLASLTAERAGPDGLRAVWQAIRDQRAPFQPAGAGLALERTSGAPDWRGLLDLLEDRTGRSYDDLWTAWVLRPNETDLLIDRDAAKVGYRDVADRAATWQMPRVVRDALRVWQYEQVGDLLNAASRALDDRDAVQAAAAAAGLKPPPTMQAAFEGPRGFTAASAEADAELAAIAAYREAASVRPAKPDLLQGIGLWGADPDAVMARATTAFQGGDLEETVRASTFARSVWDSATTIGRNRVLAIFGSLAAILLGGWLAVRWMRDRGVRRRRTLLPGA
jgi:hypothetical protein